MSRLQLFNLDNLNKTILINNYSNLPISSISLSLVSTTVIAFKTVFSGSSLTFTLNNITGLTKQVSGKSFQIPKQITIYTNIIINNIVYPELTKIPITLPATTNGVLSTRKISRIISNVSLKVIVELIITYRYVKSNRVTSWSLINGTLNIYGNS